MNEPSPFSDIASLSYALAIANKFPATPYYYTYCQIINQFDKYERDTFDKRGRRSCCMWASELAAWMAAGLC